MQRFSLQWSKANPDQLANERYMHLFLFERKGRVLFIGNPAGKDFETFIPAVAEVVDATGQDAHLWIGRVVRSASDSADTESVELMRKLLCFAERPTLNGKENYQFAAEGELFLTNHGCPALAHKLRFEHGKVIRSKKSTEERGLRIVAGKN
jgi:hypothetical protein